MTAVATGTVTAVIDAASSPAPQLPAPEPVIPPFLQRPPESPMIYQDSNGTSYDQNGRALSRPRSSFGGAPGFGFGPFSPGSNSFTNSNGDSVVPGFGPLGFAIGIGDGAGGWLWTYEQE